jgi:hypothetical protein
MVWTKLKKTAEALLAEPLNGRIEYHLANYGRGVSYFMSRGWITLDGREIANFSTIKRVRESYKMADEWYSTDPQTLEVLDKNGIFTRDDMVNALKNIIGSPIEEALQSTNPIIKAIAMLDRRLGKRRLKALSFGENEHDLVKRFYQIRVQAESI